MGAQQSGLKGGLSDSALMIKENGASLEISKEQILIIRKLWNKIRTTNPGKSICATIIEKSPEIKEMMQKASESGVNENTVCCTNSTKKTSSASKSPPVRRKKRQRSQMNCHADAYDKIIGMVIGHANNLSMVGKQLEQYGAYHARFRKYGFQLKNFAVFADVALEKSFSWCDRSEKTAEVYEAWSVIIMFIVQKLKDGYIRETRTQIKLNPFEVLKPGNSRTVPNICKIPRPTYDSIPVTSNSFVPSDPSPPRTSNQREKENGTANVIVAQKVSRPSRPAQEKRFEPIYTEITPREPRSRERDATKRSGLRKYFHRSTSHLLHSDSSLDSEQGPGMIPNLDRYLSRRSQAMYYYDKTAYPICRYRTYQ